MSNKIKGGLSDGMSISDLAKHHDVSIDTIKKQLDKGMSIELEHTDSEKIAKEIAMDHIYEDPKYYDKLKQIETESIKKSVRKYLQEEYLKRNNRI